MPTPNLITMEILLWVAVVSVLACGVALIGLLNRTERLREELRRTEGRLKRVEGRVRAWGTTGPTNDPATSRSQARRRAEEAEELPAAAAAREQRIPEELEAAEPEEAAVDPIPEREPESRQPVLTPLAKPRRSSEPFDLERLLGVRGAAIVGGIALVLAGLFFVRVAIDRGWLGPGARDGLAMGLGVLALLSHAPLRRRGMSALADSLGGAGSVLIYGAAWAAARLHGLIDVPVALAAMSVTTGITLLLAVKSRAPVVAGFALAGGFATPLVLETVAGGSLGLLIYTLVLDGALIAFARARSWHFAYPASAAGTAVLQLSWLMQSATDPWEQLVALGLVPLALTAAGALAPRDPMRANPITGWAQLGMTVAAFAPAVMGLVPGLRSAEVGIVALPPILPRTMEPNPFLPALLALPAAAALLRLGAALVASRVSGARPFGIVAALFAAASMAATTHWVDEAQGADLAIRVWSWAAALGGVLLAWFGKHAAKREPALAFGLVSIALMAILAAILDARGGEWIAMAAPVLALSTFGATGMARAGAWAGAGGLLMGLGGAFLMLVDNKWSRAWGAPIPWFTIAGAATAALAAPLLHRSPRARAALSGLAGTLALPLLLSMPLARAQPSPLVLAAAAAAASMLALATRKRLGGMQLLTLLGVAAATRIPLVSGPHPRHTGEWIPWVSLVVIAFAAPTAVAFVRRARPSLATLAALIATLPLLAVPFGVAIETQRVVESAWGWHAGVAGSGALLALLGLARWRIGRRGARVGAVFTGAGGALLLLSLARWVGSEWLIVGACLGLAWMATTALRVRAFPLAILASIGATVAAGMLILATFAEGAFPTESNLVPVQVSVDYGLCALALWGLGAANGRAYRRWPRRGATLVPHARTPAIALVLLAFAWTNATVLNHFSDGGPIRFDFDRMQARDLALSLSWAAFACGLLALGMVRRSMGLRWASLALLVTTIFKVFVHDLGALTGLARVGSLLGLSVTLMGVSLAYSRLLRAERSGQDGNDSKTGGGPEGAAAGPPISSSP